MIPCGRKSAYKGMCTLHYKRTQRNIPLYSPMQRGREHRDDEKWCSGYGGEGHWQPKSNFHNSPGRRDGLNGRCKDCISNYCKDRNTPERNRAENLKRRGLTPERFDQMVTDQQGMCSICGEEPEKWHVDHDHDCCDSGNSNCSECVRGLLCMHCNQGLGQFKDDPDRLRAAVDYLLFHSNTPTSREVPAV